MRPITKGAPAPELEARRLQHLAEIAAGTHTHRDWANFRDKADTRNRCLAEQFGLCAFSETTLDPADLGMHFDHVRPQSKARHLTFSHANLVLAAIDDVGKRLLARADVFGGHARGNRYSASGFIRPLMADCRRYFHYRSDGEVEPRAGLGDSERRRALYSIRVMNLNAPLLVNRRRTALQLLEDAVEQLLNNAPALALFAGQHLCPQQGRLPAFHSGARERFGALGDAVMAQQCPACA